MRFKFRLMVVCKCDHFREPHTHFASTRKMFHPDGIVATYCSATGCKCNRWRPRIKRIKIGRTTV